MLRKAGGALMVLAVAAALGGCGDTWRGAKKDTGENLEKAGQAIDRAGKSIKN